MINAGFGHRHIAAACALLAGAVAGLGASESTGFSLDDAYIHLSYARSSALGQGFSYNPGDWETGASSPLWALMLVPFATLQDPARAVQLLGVVLHGATALVCSLGAARLVAPARAQAAAAIAGVVVATHPGLLQGALSGMEVSLTALLLSWALLAMFAKRVALGFGLSVLAVWARPEAALLLGTAGGLGWLHTRDRRLLAVPLGAAAGLLAWIVFCLVVSGYPWPNTRYVKSAGTNAAGLAYFLVQVVPREPWLLGVGGPVLVVLHMRRDLPALERRLPWLLMGAWFAASLAVAVTRALDPAVLFYHHRYFLPLSVVPALSVGIAAATSAPRTRLLWVAPVLLLSVWMALDTQALQRRQEHNIMRLHEEPSRYLASQLPARSVVVVEGAGASRFFTPREMTIVDMLGLNDRRIAHSPKERRPCLYVAARPTHLMLPDFMLTAVLPLFRTTTVARWVEPLYAQTITVRPLAVTLYRVDGLSDIARSHCPHEASQP